MIEAFEDSPGGLDAGVDGVVNALDFEHIYETGTIADNETIGSADVVSLGVARD